MNIAGTEYNLNHKALEIYLAGCKGPHCAGCHNPYLWDFNVGIEWAAYKAILEEKLNIGFGMIDQIWILGGEPQDNEELNTLLKFLAEYGKTIVLFTRYNNLAPWVDSSHLTYVKFGPYDCFGEAYEEPVLGLTLASRNQYIRRINENCSD